MPIYKVTVKEETVRKVVAYVDASHKDEACAWATLAPDYMFEHDADKTWSAVDVIEEIEQPPEGCKINQIAWK